MAVGRISGPLLKSNLIRNGIDLAFETDLLYLDVTSQRIGIKTTTPTHELEVSGTTKTTNLLVDTQADLGNVTIVGNTISSTQPYLNLGTFDNVVYQNKARIDSIDIEGNVISTNDSNANLEFRPNGTGVVEVYSNMDVQGDIHATGNITADGNITLGDADTDNVIFNAEVASNIIPDTNNTYTLGSNPDTGGKEWNDIWVNNLVATSINSTALEVDGIDLTFRNGNSYYVAENGNDSNTGNHIQDPYATITQALSAATAGDTVFINPGEYTEAFPLTIPVGVTVKGSSLRSVTVRPTTATRYNDAFLLNGETTVEDLMITGFQSGGNFYEVTAAGASPIWNEQQNVVSSTTSFLDEFGGSVAISGDTAIVGARRDGDDGSNSGSANIFTRTGGTWTEQQKLTASDAATLNYFGTSVAISGDTAIVGAPEYPVGGEAGSAYVFTRSGSTWTEQQKLTASDGSEYDNFGYSVSIDGDTVVIGAQGDDNVGSSSGSAYVFTRSGSTWTEQQKLTASDAANLDLFGVSTAISGDTVVIGAYLDNAPANDSGSAYVFTRSGSTWTEQQKLTASDGTFSDFFGTSVAISSDTVVIGARGDNTESGSAYVFTRSGSTWTQQQKLTASDAHAEDQFGTSVAISGDTVVIGALEDEYGAGSRAGSAYVFTTNGSTWTLQEKIISSNVDTNDYFGSSVAISGDYIISGALGDANRTGRAYFFNKPGGTSNTTVNVGITAQPHSYVSGGTISIDDIEYPITGAGYNETTGVIEIYHTGGLSTVGNNVFISNLTFSCNGGNRTFPDNGYAFRFATDYTVTSRSPYIRNVTVITSGSTTTVEDPRGFNAGDAGKGAYIDGAYATAASKEASMLFHSATFIVPGVDGIVATNGVRIEWLNSFTYFANRSFHAYDSNDGKYGAGKTRIRLGGLLGTAPAAGQTVTFTSSDSSTVVGPLNIESVINGDILVIDGKNENLIGFDTTPATITFSGTGTATTILNYDLKDFGAEIRMIGSASVYGNYGLVGDGAGVIIYAIGHNLAYVGNGKEITNDPTTVIQANEVVELNGAQVRYNTVDHKGDFRVGELFYVNQEDGSVSFTASNLNIDITNGVTLTTGGNNTVINGEKIDTGNLRISGNTIESLSGNINFSSANDQIDLLNNVNITGDLDVTGNVTIGGNITIGNEVSDTIQIIAGIDSDLVPNLNSTYSLGVPSKRWNNIWTNQANIDGIVIRDNYIETIDSNADLELRASGTGEILIPNNNVQINNNLTVDGTSILANTNITGTITINGSLNQTGNTTVIGDISVLQDLLVNASAQFEEILVDDNFITTTTSNTNLELRANGTGNILIPNNNVVINNDLTINGITTTVDITSTGVITADSFTNNTILIDNNVIETISVDTNLDLRANGSGKIIIPSNNVDITQALTVNGNTVLANTNITGTVTHVGNYNQTGNTTITGNLNVLGNLDVSGAFQFEEILVDDNFITTTTSNTNLELRANGTGNILIPNNNVIISNNLTVNGTLNVGNIDSIGTIQANNFTTGDILIDDNFITTTISNSNLELRSAGTGSIIIDDISINDSTITSTSNLILQPGSGTVNIIGTGSLVLPKGNTSERPTPAAGQIRYNTELERFEGYNNTGWINLKGVQDQDGNTRVTAELTEGANDNTIRFIIEDATVVDITSQRLSAPKVLVDNIQLDGNVISTITADTDLVLSANGTGRVVLDNIAIKDNVILNTVSGSNTLLQSTGTGYVEIGGTAGIVLPIGDDTNRPPVSSAGMIRYHTVDERVELFDGTNWVSVAGSSGGISFADAEDIAIEKVLIFG